jgi:deoxyribodipyrimidine photolyase
MALGPMPIQVAWLKRDLRLHDHRPLLNALRSGPTLLIYIAEPTLWRQPDAAPQHWKFIAEALLDLDRSLRQTGVAHACLHLFVGEAVEVLQAIHRCLPMAALHAHMETGNGLTFARDRAVRRWAKEVGIPFYLYPQTSPREPPLFSKKDPPHSNYLYPHPLMHRKKESPPTQKSKKLYQGQRLGLEGRRPTERAVYPRERSSPKALFLPATFASTAAAFDSLYKPDEPSSPLFQY